MVDLTASMHHLPNDKDPPDKPDRRAPVAWTSAPSTLYGALSRVYRVPGQNLTVARKTTASKCFFGLFVGVQTLSHDEGVGSGWMRPWPQGLEELPRQGETERSGVPFLACRPLREVNSGSTTRRGWRQDAWGRGRSLAGTDTPYRVRTTNAS